MRGQTLEMNCRPAPPLDPGGDSAARFTPKLALPVAVTSNLVVRREPDMAEATAQKSSSAGIGFWTMSVLVVGLLAYLLGFAVLILFPSASRLAESLGITNEALETVYAPIIRLLE
jgi:hypothetical protein